MQLKKKVTYRNHYTVVCKNILKQTADTGYLTQAR